MSQPTRSKIVLADPCPHDGDPARVIVGGAGELRLYEWQHRKGSTRFRTVACVSELGQIRSFAWSPNPTRRDLVAAGLHAGRIVILRLDSAPAMVAARIGPTQAIVPTAPAAVQINIRHSRPCNVVTFCPDRPSFLAVGLEKGRGESLLIYDIEQSARAIDPVRPYGFPSSDTLVREQPQSSSPSAPEPMPLLSFGSSESVSCAAFLSSDATTPSSSPLLVAAMAGKWLRAYDLRTPPRTVITWGTRAGTSLAANPFNERQLVSSGDDGVVKLWDMRKPMDALLSFSEVDAGAVSARVRPTVVARPLIEMEWSRVRSGVITTLERDGHNLRVWDLVDGPSAKLETDHDPDAHQRSEDVGISPGSMRMPIVLSDSRPRQFQHALSSFTSLSSLGPTGSTHYLGVSRDTASPGSSGHRLEVIEAQAPRHTAFLDGAVVVEDGESSTRLVTMTIPRPQSAQPVDTQSAEAVEIPVRRPMLDRGRRLSLDVSSLGYDRHQTPRPSGSVTPRQLSRNGQPVLSTRDPERLGRLGLTALSADISSLMRERIERGYGSDAHINATLFDGSIAEMWLWIARAEVLAADAFINDFDFAYRGVLPILVGFSSTTQYAQNKAAGRPRHTSPHASPRSTGTRSIYSDISRSLRKGDEAQSKNKAYADAVNACVKKRKLDGTFAISSSSFASQRKLALYTCGQDWGEDADVVCARFAADDNYEAAARHAFFSGHLEKSMSYLKNCKEESFRMLAPILAAYIAQRDTRGHDSAYADTCRSLSSDGDTPWIRAMFAFLASGDWRELVDEVGLPLRDRVAVALRFLSDSELLPFLQDLGNEAMGTGDPEAIVLFGLRGDGYKLLSTFVDRTADIQTVALAVSFVSPGIIRSDRRIQRWIQTYRNALDGLQLYATRAIFDSSRGRRARAAADQARRYGRHTEAAEIEQALRKAAPPQLIVRCQFCSSTISPTSSANERGSSHSVAGSSMKSTLCPSCSKSLPGCAVCLQKPSMHSVPSDESAVLCWCQRCRHGGESPQAPRRSRTLTPSQATLPIYWNGSTEALFAQSRDVTVDAERASKSLGFSSVVAGGLQHQVLDAGFLPKLRFRPKHIDAQNWPAYPAML